MHQDGSLGMFPFGSLDVWGLATSKPSCPNYAFGIDLTPTPISVAKLRIFHIELM